MTTKLAFFPATSGRRHILKVINKEPVLKVESKTVPFNGGIQHRYRLSITPWDLQRIIKEANSLGLEGHKVKFFGYDCDSNTVQFGPPFQP